MTLTKEELREYYDLSVSVKRVECFSAKDVTRMYDLENRASDAQYEKVMRMTHGSNETL